MYTYYNYVHCHPLSPRLLMVEKYHLYIWVYLQPSGEELDGAMLCIISHKCSNN